MKRWVTICVLAAAVLVVACDSGGDDDAVTSTPPIATTTVASVPTLPPPTATVVAPTAALVLVPPPAPAAVGAPVLVTVRITGATNLAAFQFTPVFDEAVLQLVNITDAGFAGSTGRVPTCSMSRMERTTYFCVSGGAQPPGPSGDGDLAVLEFRALAPGETQIALEAISASMPDASDIPLSTEPIAITVQ